MKPEIWNLIVKAIGSLRNCPSWLKDQSGLSWEAISQLPGVDATGNGQPAIPTVEEKAVDQDYLDFLREQIALNPRGPEWLALLNDRLKALEPFVNKELMVVTFHSKPHSAILRIPPDTGDVIHAETI